MFGTRPFWFVVVVISAAASSRPLFSQEDQPEAPRSLAAVIAECEKATVRIEVDAGRGFGGSDKVIGSGFVIDSTGIIATNAHVLESAQRAKATFPDGTEVQILGTLTIDSGRDICIAKVDAANLPVLKLAAELPQKGEKVVALGCPVGLSFSATSGIVSAIRGEKEMRNDTGGKDLRGTWIQVDAALSPGNSGGPLINEIGEVVAMSTLASFGLVQNLNFGISAEEIRRVAEASQGKQVVRFNPAAPRRGPAVAVRPRGAPRGMVEGSGAPRLGIRPSLPDTSRLLEPDSATANHYSYQFPPPANAVVEPFTNKRPTEPSDSVGLANYVKTGRTLYSTFYKDILSSVRRMEAELQESKKELEKQDDQKGHFGDFSAQVKREKLVETMDELERRKAIRDSLSPQMTNDSLLTFLKSCGPPINMQSNDSVGHLGRCRVLGVMGSDALFIARENFGWGLWWVESTEGITAGQMIDGGVVYYLGHEACALPAGASTNLREFPVYLSVDGDKLKEAVLGRTATSANASSDFRLWTDASGQFSVEAVLENVDGDTVQLRRRDGTLIKIQKSKFSKADLEALNK